jgi:hypothetical protein
MFQLILESGHGYSVIENWGYEELEHERDGWTSFCSLESENSRNVSTTA